MRKTPPNPSRLANGQGFPPPNPSRLANGHPQPFTTCKQTRVAPPPPSPPPPPTLHDLQMDKGSPPPTRHDLQMDKALQPPNLRTWGRPPSGQQPFTTCKWTRVAPQPFMTCKWTRVGGPATLHDKETAEKWTRVGVDFQMDKGWGPSQPRFANGQGWGPTLHDSPPQPFTTCKWTRAGGPPTLHDLQMDKRKRPKNGQGLGLTSKWTRVGGLPNPDLQMDKGGAQPFTTPPPTLHDLQMDKGWGPPNPSRLANGQRLDKGWGPPEFITSTAVGQGLDPLNLSRFGSGSPNKLYRFNIRFQSRPGVLSEDRQINDRAFRPRTYPNANL